jgi:CII-binding regulator of phage lambda lysogenization HflD
MKMDYSKNIELALALGFEEVLDEKAFKGKYYVKDSIVWIHDITALKRKLGVSSDQELRDLSYDVDNYHEYVNHTNEMVNSEMASLYSAITHEDGEPTYLSDGVWLYPDGTMGER